MQTKEMPSRVQKILPGNIISSLLLWRFLFFGFGEMKVVKLGKMCIEVSPNSKLAFISEELCIGCGICIKKCPFEAINIINLPKSLDSCQAIFHFNIGLIFSI